MPKWRKSSRSSDPQGLACVEVAGLDGNVGVRDSTQVEKGENTSPVLNVSVSAFGGLLRDIKNGQYAL